MADTGSSAAAAAAVEVTVDATQPEHVTANVIAAPAPEAKEQVRHVNTCFFLMFRTVAGAQVPTFVQRPGTPHRHHNHTTRHF